MSLDENPGLVQLTPEQRQHLRDKLSVAIAERRHHDQIYLQAFVGGIVILGIYLVALDGVMTRGYSSNIAHWLVFGGTLAFGAALALVVYWHIVDQRSKRDICGDIAERVNRVLACGKLEATVLDSEVSVTVIEERQSRLKKPQLPQRPKDRWEWVYLGMYVGMIIVLLVILAAAYRPAAQWQAEESPVTTEVERCVEDENRQDSAGIRITMTGISEDDSG